MAVSLTGDTQSSVDFIVSNWGLNYLGFVLIVINSEKQVTVDNKYFLKRIICATAQFFVPSLQGI